MSPHEHPEILIVVQKISRGELKKFAEARFGDMVKAVVDIEKRLMAVGGEMHADEEAFLMERGSEQRNLWGINLYPDVLTEEWLEFDSMINVRPRHGNRSRGIDEVALREVIRKIVNDLAS
ncbi:MAG: hypothetical protein HW383_784 [Candidatus Magasanikbacteria bacterium]|nr:hypothetical protein [Candidatus Magasanikbacteria bacterium]